MEGEEGEAREDGGRRGGEEGRGEGKEDKVSLS